MTEETVKVTQKPHRAMEAADAAFSRFVTTHVRNVSLVDAKEAVAQLDRWQAELALRAKTIREIVGL